MISFWWREQSARIIQSSCSTSTWISSPQLWRGVHLYENCRISPTADYMHGSMIKLPTWFSLIIRHQSLIWPALCLVRLDCLFIICLSLTYPVCSLFHLWFSFLWQDIIVQLHSRTITPSSFSFISLVPQDPPAMSYYHSFIQLPFPLQRPPQPRPHEKKHIRDRIHKDMKRIQDYRQYIKRRITSDSKHRDLLCIEDKNKCKKGSNNSSRRIVQQKDFNRL